VRRNGWRAHRTRLTAPDVNLEQAGPARISFHAITGLRWTSADAGAGVGIGGLGDEEPKIIRGQDEPSRRRAGEDHGAERYVDVYGRLSGSPFIVNDLAHTGGRERSE